MLDGQNERKACPSLVRPVLVVLLDHGLGVLQMEMMLMARTTLQGPLPCQISRDLQFCLLVEPQFRLQAPNLVTDDAGAGDGIPSDPGGGPMNSSGQDCNGFVPFVHENP